MDLLLTVVVVISGVLLLIWSFLGIFMDLLARTAAAPSFQLAEIVEADISGEPGFCSNRTAPAINEPTIVLSMRNPGFPRHRPTLIYRGFF